MGDHDDQAVLGNLLEQVHDLHGSGRVEGAGGLVGKENLRVVDEGAGNGHALHLAAGKLARALVHVLAQADALQGLLGATLALGAADAREREGQLDVLQDGLVRDEVVALEHEANAVVAVGVPVAVLVALGRDAIDDQVAGVKVVKAADDVQRRGLARAGRAQDGNELVVPEGQAHVVQGDLGERRGDVLLADVLELKHPGPL